MKPQFYLFILTASLLLAGCKQKQRESDRTRIPVILDTDANNEIDDQHAIAYLLSNEKVFQIEGITVNATRNGGNIEQHVQEADRILKLFERDSVIPLVKGANGNFEEILPEMSYWDFDGYQAVNFIIRTAKRHTGDTLTIIAIGKLTNIALAVKKDPSVIPYIRLVWLGSNFPEPGEYNLENDIPAMNYLLHTGIHFEIVVVRYGKPSGTDAVRITKEKALNTMPGLGPHITKPVTGRHGGKFYNFGDYSASLFENTVFYGDPPSRALFDVCAVAVVKNPELADSMSVPRHVMTDGKWVEQPGLPGKIVLWENFKKDEILTGLFYSLQNDSGQTD